MARSEFLEGRRELLRGSIEKRKRAIQRIEESKERHEMGTADIETRFPKEMAVGLDRMRQLRGEFVAKPKRETEVEEDESKSANKAQEAMHWKGGGGNYGMVREQAKGAAGFRAVGGMRDPHLSVRALPTVQALGKRTWELWEEFVKEDRRALCVAESYGTEDCRFDEDAVQAWKDKLYEMWNVQKVKQGVALKANDIYYTPVDWEMAKEVRRPREVGTALAGSGRTSGYREEHPDRRHLSRYGRRGGQVPSRVGQRSLVGEGRHAKLQVG